MTGDSVIISSMRRRRRESPSTRPMTENKTKFRFAIIGLERPRVPSTFTSLGMPVKRNLPRLQEHHSTTGCGEDENWEFHGLALLAARLTDTRSAIPTYYQVTKVDDALGPQQTYRVCLSSDPCTGSFVILKSGDGDRQVLRFTIYRRGNVVQMSDRLAVPKEFEVVLLDGSVDYEFSKCPSEDEREYAQAIGAQIIYELVRFGVPPRGLTLRGQS
jgi:hypothetical protein